MMFDLDATPEGASRAGVPVPVGVKQNVRIPHTPETPRLLLDMLLDISEATPTEIADMHRIRVMVKENRLSAATRIGARDYAEMITTRGKGWVCRVGGTIRGFAVVDMSDGNIWALFVEPGFERSGIGRALHDAMVGWAFGHGRTALWLTTDRATRAENFYRLQGWREAGSAGTGQLRFELEKADWKLSP